MGWFLLLSILIACPLIILFHWLLLLAFFASPLSSAPLSNDSMSQGSILVLLHLSSKPIALILSICWQFPNCDSRDHLFPEFQILKSHSLPDTSTWPSTTHLKSVCQKQNSFSYPQTCSYSVSLSLLPHLPTCSIRKSSPSLLFPCLL